MRNVCYNEYDAAEVLAGLILIGDGTQDPNPDRHVDLLMALKAIKPTLADVCLLYAQGYKQSEIGRRIGRSQPTVCRMIQRGMVALRTEMNRE